MAEPTAAHEAAPWRMLGVSVIIPTWNEAKYLPSLLDALHRQAMPPLEILVADSGSSDGTQEIARRAGAVLLEGERRGPGEGRNRGARAAKGDFLLFVDADCLVPPNLVETAAAAGQDSDIVGGATRFMALGGGGLAQALFSPANGSQRAMTHCGFPPTPADWLFFRRLT